MLAKNLADAQFEFDPEDPEGFRAGLDRLGRAFGAKSTGASLYELPPGQALCPYHYEYGEEEWLVVLEGTPLLRDPDGERELSRGDIVFFPRGPEGAHGIRNAGSKTVRVLMFSDVVLPTGTAYPDSDKVALWTGDEAEDAVVRRSSTVGYYEGESPPE